MKEQDDPPGRKPRPGYDLTQADIFSPQGGQGRPPQPPGPDDRTTINRPVAQPPERRPDPPPPQNRYDLTSVNVGVGYDDEEPASRAQSAQQQHAAVVAPPPARPAAAAPKPRRRVPVWVWSAAAAASFVFLLALGGLAYFLLSSPSAFTLRVLNAPAGSKVYVDDIPSGVPQRDGTILVQGLRAGEPREVRVAAEGYADWKTSVTGKGGEVLDVTAEPAPLRAAKKALPAEIDYNGPMVLIAAGRFTMGFNGGAADESPEHAVELPDYYIDKFEVKNEQYAKFCEATGHPRPVNPFWSPQYFETNPRMPVVGVSYADAAAYAAWAGKRLPTEAEWEKAASWGPGATAKRQYPWGNTFERGRANLDSAHPTNVGASPAGASAYGVQDLSGNAHEWVDSTYDAYPGSAASEPDFGKGLRVVRGGNFRRDSKVARTTSRVGIDPSLKTTPEDLARQRSSLIGFRCAVSADDPRLKAHLQQPRR